MFGRLKSPSLNLLLVILLCVWGVIAGAVLLAAQESAPPSQPAAQGYPVTVEGHEVLQVYVALGPVSAHDRAQKASDRLRKLVYTPSADLGAINIVESEYG